MNLPTMSRLGWPITLLLSFIPLIIWAIFPYSLDKRFLAGGELKYALTMTALGQVLGLVGMAMFALNLVLGARLGFIESLFGGMNKVYIAHHILGGLSFVLLLLHPLFLLLRFAPAGAMALGRQFVQFIYSPYCVKNVSLFSIDCSVTYGVLALALMIIFLVLTFFVVMKYHIWKWTHKFLGLAFFFGSLHVLTIPSDTTQVNAMKYYMFALIAIGFGAIFYRTLLGFFVVPRRVYIVDEVREMNSSVVEIVLSPKNGKNITYTPGQFIFIGFPDTPGLSEVHPFSLSSSPSSGKLTIGVKVLGDYTNRIKELKPGAKAVVEGPFGRTSYVYYPRKEQIWIAGGIGITPFLGMARSIKSEDGYRIDLYYSALTDGDAVWHDELSEIAKKNPGFRLIPWYGAEKGFLTADAISQVSGGLLGKEIFLCGPSGMMSSLKTQFAQWKVPARSIHSEEFSMN